MPSWAVGCQDVHRLADDDAGDRRAVGGEHGQPAAAVREHVAGGVGQAVGERARRPASGPAPGRTAARSRRRPGCRARRPPAAPSALRAVGQSCRRPLWLNSQRSWVNGAAAPTRRPAMPGGRGADRGQHARRRRPSAPARRTTRRSRSAGPAGSARAARPVDVPADAEAVDVDRAVPLPARAPRTARRAQCGGSTTSDAAACAARRGRPGAYTSRAVRKPEKICRRIGWSQLRNVVRQASGSVAQEPPRSTL